MNETSKQSPKRRWIGIISTTVTCLLILAASAAAIVVIQRTEPTAKQIDAKRVSAALVETLTVERGTYSPRLVVLGTVQAAQDIVLAPRVGGLIVEISPEFAPGETVTQGDLLLRIDPVDFENALSIRKSELEQTEATLEIEQGRQTLAEKELTLLEGTIDEMNTALVLREPQIASINAQISAAKSEVERAQIDLDRTSITAPFDAHILSRSVNVGSQVDAGDELARLVGIEEYWIMASVPIRSLRWVMFPDSDGQGSSVELADPNSWPDGIWRPAKVSRMIGTLDEQTRLARVLITVDDPLARKSDAPPLILGTLLEAHIEGRPIEDVVRLSREHIHDGDTVWVMVDQELEIREAEIMFRDADHAYVRDGLNDGDEVVTTTLATVANGIRLRKVNDSVESSVDSATEAEE